MVEEQSRRSVVGLCFHDHVARDVVPRIGDAVGRDALRLSERGALIDDRVCVLGAPFHPRHHARGLAFRALLLVEPFELFELLCRPRVDRQECLHRRVPSDVVVLCRGCFVVCLNPSKRSASFSAAARSERRRIGSAVVRAITMLPTQRFTISCAFVLPSGSFAAKAARNTPSIRRTTSVYASR